MGGSVLSTRPCSRGWQGYEKISAMLGRWSKHRAELFRKYATMVGGRTEPEIWRELNPVVIMRKVDEGTRSEDTLEHRTVWRSFFKTPRRQRKRRTISSTTSTRKRLLKCKDEVTSGVRCNGSWNSTNKRGPDVSLQGKHGERVRTILRYDRCGFGGRLWGGDRDFRWR